MLSMKARYAIRALTALASYPVDQPVLVADIARSECIPRRFLEGILHQLRQRGVVSSRRGRGGGYSLLQPAEEITVEAVVAAMDGPIASEPCFNIQVRRSCHECQSFAECGTRLVLDRVYSSVKAALQGLTIAELARHTHRQRVEPPVPSAPLSARPRRRGFPQPAH
jgi:Rrf2 family protein